jgi:hypothetical protein
MSKNQHEAATKRPHPEKADKALQDAQPDWDRMGEIADRLLSTPPDRQALGKALAPKREGKPRP